MTLGTGCYFANCVTVGQVLNLSEPVFSKWETIKLRPLAGVSVECLVSAPSQLPHLRSQGLRGHFKQVELAGMRGPWEPPIRTGSWPPTPRMGGPE